MAQLMLVLDELAVNTALPPRTARQIPRRLLAREQGACKVMIV